MFYKGGGVRVNSREGERKKDERVGKKMEQTRAGLPVLNTYSIFLYQEKLYFSNRYPSYRL